MSWSEHCEYHVLTSSHDKTAKLWDTRTAVPLHTLEGHTDKVLLMHHPTMQTENPYACAA